MKHTISLTLLLSLSSLSGCSEYWWTRGQPPASAEILSRAQERIQEVEKSTPFERGDIVEIAKMLSSEFKSLTSDSLENDQMLEILKNVEQSLKSLEGKLSYGNRPPLQELSGQFRAIKEKGLNSGVESLPKESLRLFAARVLFMLSSEIKVPAPDPIVAS